jgi:Fe-S-cluster-containing dehydrogenase component
VFACPFGIPKLMSELDQMMKCDQCYDRTSVGLAPMCASVCPSQALWFGTPQEFAATRSGQLSNTFVFGAQLVRTKVYSVVREPGPVEVRVGRGRTHWLDDPFGLDEGESS